ncbi:MAG: peptide-methionine (S)-S-oxide reductase [Alkalibacterium sp.]|uniref:peptide-methionine (S)-S-oxide reductase n=1 Tax=Alkalibacterium gilvum TaxID=1130080 RepID=A0A1H6TYR5_9LACT|nr:MULTISPECIES: peptide-methionine (S)-S-oxide reductase [Alkalibacterium]MDN6193582.1 peptide-methionine (S)-S-oxide reductase [Alkalibacterium sp.]MDN6293750.1 peptide-methionine (S)-S-oxide reductase [Alkalibacterium sp.]MDN6294897.1 peptide-methionine (S)-S-oxide reductase [Alkalibacterium sp.]MDN6326471.1 peptide-methionine (S)-S-oxide reductase [Alkalibacterium sp.]MDN6385439.1 peptide-methionine (S)-S-oxide reductase [Alkalibacterium sp.]
MQNLNRRAKQLEFATFGMGCFWGPESQFGQYSSVIHTRTGFAGGTSSEPTYRNMGDHTETVQIAFDSTLLSYEDILRIFWDSHDAFKDRYFKERQYISLLIVHSTKQLRIAEKVKNELENKYGKTIQTEIQFDVPFYPAEERHQKYFLKRFEKAMTSLLPLFNDHTSFAHSTIAARLNGFVKEHGRLDAIKNELSEWQLTQKEEALLREMLATIRW